MLKLLVPVEENEIRHEMINALVLWLRRIATPHQIHLINVQPAIHGDVSMFLSHDQIQDFQRDEGLKELDGTMKQLESEEITFEHHICVGDAAEVIAQFARQNEMHQIVIGYRSFSALEALLRGSLPARVIQLADVPVMLIK
jgi:nucleotide-binding universal stress UspA family protein